MRRPIQSLAVALCLASVTAAPAHAQLLKRIKQAATDKIVDKTVDKGAEKAGIASSPSSSDSAAAGRVNRGSQGVYAPSRPAAASGSSKLEITDARITAFIDAMAPVVAAGHALRAERDAKTRADAYNACKAKVMTAGMQPIAKDKEAEADRLSDQMSKLSDQLLPAMQAHDTVRTNALSDSMQTLGDKHMRLLYPAMAKCGAQPPKPASGGARTNADGSVAGVAPKKVAGVSESQFGRMRERIALYLIDPTRPNDLSPDERSALDARSKDLGELAAGFKSNLYNWQTWSELWSAWK